MKLTKNGLKQLIREMMEAEEMEAAEVEPDVEGTEGLDFDNLPSGVYKFPSNYWIVGPERDRAKEEDPGMKELEDHVMEGGEGLILGKSDGGINVLVVFRAINPFTGLDRGVGWGREGFSGGTRGGFDLSPEKALDYLKGGAELIQDEEVKTAFMSVTEEDLENMPDNTYFVAKTDKKGPKEERPKSRPSRSSRGYERPDDYYHDSRRDRRSTGGSYRPFKRFEESKLTKGKNKMKLTKSVLKQMIREQIEEKPSGSLHDAYYAMRDFVDNLQDDALRDDAIDLADDLFDAIDDVMPFPDRD